MRFRNTNIKLLIISGILASLFLMVGANVFIVSVFGYHINSKTNISDLIEDIHVVNKELPAQRGKILDRNHTVIAQDKTAFTLYAHIDDSRVTADGDPAYVVDKEAAAQEIAKIIDEDYDVVLERLKSEGLKQVEFGLAGKKISLEQKEALENTGISGLGFKPILVRHYPLQNFSSSLLGISLYDEQEKSLTGRFGIELNYEDQLKGKNGFKKYQQDKDGYILPQVEVLEEKPVDGNDIVLTLDRPIQEALEESLENIAKHEEVRATELWGAVVEAKTGKVVAWADYPTFNPNKLDIETYMNRGSQFTYEPGSTMKTFTVGALIDQGLYKGDETFDSGAFHVGVEDGKAIRLSNSHNSVATITNAQNIDYGMMTYDYGYDMSSNVMIAEILTKKLDPEIFRDYLHQLGFFKEVSGDKIPEEPGLELWEWPLEKVTNGFGQGSTVTMLQLLQAYTAVFNNGTMLKPYFIDEIIEPNTNEVLYKGKPIVSGQPFKESTALQLQDMMRTVVTQGSAQRFNVEEIEVVGKTGTAQMVVDGVYSPTDYIFSSVLGFPYNDPEYIVYTAYVAKYGHNITHTSPYVNDLVRKVVSTYSLKDSYDNNVIEKTQTKRMPSLINQSIESAKNKLEQEAINYVLVGNGENIISQFPASNEDILSNEKVILFSGGNEFEVPDFKSWSRKQVENFSSITGIKIQIEGQGFVEEQSIPKGELIGFEDEIILYLK